MIEINKITDVIKHISGLKAIVFDLDDTLYSEKNYVKSGFSAISDFFPQIINFEVKLWNAFENNLPAIDTVLTETGLYTDKLKNKCLEIYRNHQPNISLYDGVSDMLINFKEQGYKIGIITDGRPEGQRAKIKALGLNSYVDYIIVTDELGGVEYRKPNPASFEQMKNELNVMYNQMCYIGDNIKKDFIAPNQLGMRAIHFRNPDGLYN